MSRGIGTAEMKAEKRLEEIVSLLRINNAMPVSDIASRLEVSHMTVRRDLRILEARSVVRMIHGGAVIADTAGEGGQGGQGRTAPAVYELPAAMSEMTAEKMRIGRAAASMVRRGSSLSIDTGSTTEHIARALPEEMDLSVEILPVLTPRGDRWFVLFTPSKITAYPRLLDDCLFRQWYVDQGEFFEDSNGTHFFSAEELADHPELRFDS